MNNALTVPQNQNHIGTDTQTQTNTPTHTNTHTSSQTAKQTDTSTNTRRMIESVTKPSEVVKGMKDWPT